MNPKMSTLRVANAGFTLLEILVALGLGLLLSIGILSLFGSTSRTNKLQNGLARLQENGRFATTRMETDLRMTSAQFCSNFSGPGTPGSVVPVIPRRAPMVLTSALALPDPGPDAGGAGLTTMNSIDGAGYPSASVAATIGYVLSPRYFIQGYSCKVAGTCAPAGLPADLPAEGTDAGDRLPASDVLTIRYQRGTGWPVNSATPTCASGANLTLARASGDDQVNLAGGELALVTDCINASVLPVAAASGTSLTLGTLMTGSAICSNAAGDRDMRAFNFTKDFVTVTYYVGLREDLNPDARPNSPTAAKRVIPVLIRRENGGPLHGGAEQELVQGVDQLAFRYGVQDGTGATRFMEAQDVDASSACPPPPDGVTTEPGCLWRAVRTIEAHLLMNTVDEVFHLDDSSREYHFLGAPHVTTDTGPLPSGLKAGSTLRREFIAYVSNRNYNF
jgi:type IV pilus assembly protein PilW